jgi:hypothetical protein
MTPAEILILGAFFYVAAFIAGAIMALLDDGEDDD